jgi:hypothetical protein
MTLHTVVLQHRVQQLKSSAAAKRIAERAWRSTPPGTQMLRAWAKQVPGLVQVTRRSMAVAATGSDAYVTAALGQQGAKSEAAGRIVASSFAETANDGRLLGPLLYLPALTVNDLIAAGQTPAQAMSAGLADLLTYVASEVADAGRSSVGVAMLADRRVQGYYREPGAGACDRCAVLAGKWFGSYQTASFDRHPRCQCSAVPAVGRGSGNPVAQSPRSYFDGLPAARQDALFGKANAQAIRDGADVSQVVNAKRGMTGAWSTTEGTTSSGLYGGYTAKGIAGAPRLTPAAIYRLAATRDEAVAMFREYGYLT